MLNGALIDIINPVVTPDPNVTQPPDTTVTVLPLANGNMNIPWMAVLGGDAEVTFWCAPLDDSPRTWFPIALGALSLIVVLVPAGVMLSAGFFVAGAIPAGMPVHLQVVSVAGTTRIVAGLTKS